MHRRRSRRRTDIESTLACGDAEDIGNTQMMDDWATQIKTRFALDVEVDSKVGEK